ncbi:MAG: ABC transporter substrate-binding protein [Candidatus Pelagibacter bacterium]|jgi:hypothetical protein|nr:ABC transporter substrate-binding protein [Candidatus Pelagibacter bacterium]|tara:strand:- start:815 stop:1966 length:1152 start_codon:yes stop_codon:yes gene_type:complete
MKIIIQFILFIFISLFLDTQRSIAQEKIKIGLIVPLSGEYKEIGRSIVNSTRLAINKIDNSKIEILPRDTKSNPRITLRVAKELHELGVKIIIGPVFNKNLIYLEELNEVIFLSLTNKITNNPKNIISAGINAISQINTIIKFQELYDIQRSIFLIPNSDFKNEIEEAISKTKIKLKDTFIYDTNPTLLTAQIEKITRYPQRKQRLENEIKRLKNSNEINKEKKITDLEKKDTLGGVNFDSVIIADFDESLKSVATSLLYTDISSKRVHYICLNQWFDESLLKEISLQPIYFPSINKENYDEFVTKYFNIYQKFPNQISFLSYDLVGLVYYLIYKNNFIVNEKIFYKKNKFKGKIGVFEIDKNKISHLLNFYVAKEEKFKKIF